MMRRFKAWLFVWLMGEHFAEIERDIDMLRKSHEALAGKLDARLRKLEDLKTVHAGVSAPKKVIQSRNWADFQRLAGDPDSKVQ
jgi:hypothetical protein